MKRRNFIKSVACTSLTGVVPFHGLSNSLLSEIIVPKLLSFKDNWKDWPDMRWIGPEYWGNCIQDWELIRGEAVCRVTANNRSLHLLTVQNEKSNTEFHTAVKIDLLNNNLSEQEDLLVGIRVGAKGPNFDYRSAAVFGKGIDIGITDKGAIKIGDTLYETELKSIPERFNLNVRMKKSASNAEAELKVSINPYNPVGVVLYEVAHTVPADAVNGNFALLAHSSGKDNEYKPFAAFSNWSIEGNKMIEILANSFGPVTFAQYTLNKGVLKLTAQLTPIEEIKNHKVTLELFIDGKWKHVDEQKVHRYARVVCFRIENWKETDNVAYRVRADIPLKSNIESYYYSGTIAKEPMESDEVKAAIFSCNCDYGFPDTDIYDNVKTLDADIIFFLGDQFYEATGGFGLQRTGGMDVLSLEYLRKWYMFGWSYRDIYRHKPCAIIPDDHDVWHGNLWGESGKKANTELGYGYESQDTGGFKMNGEFINMVELSQTSHLPDAYNSTPVKQGIGVYYTEWNYAGISFAILEDRKFKSAPKNVLPEEAQVKNGFIQNRNFDIKEYKDIDASLLGDRQIEFIEHWAQNWQKETDIKVVLSQTNFATIATLPKGEIIDEIVPKLPIPEKGKYVEGDDYTTDMDSNGWPQKGRNRALKAIRKAFAFHIAGDQHLPSFSQYGIDQFGDSGHVFAAPALNNIWPRRFWPPADTTNHTYDNPAYIGNHQDGFGNKITIKAIGNPFESGYTPKIIHNRSTGYGLVTFNKKTGDVITECWPRYAKPAIDRGNQFAGWPVKINQLSNYGSSSELFLPTLHLKSVKRPLVSVYNSDGDHICTTRVFSNVYQPKVMEKGKYNITVKDENNSILFNRSGINAEKNNVKSYKIS